MQVKEYIFIVLFYYVSKVRADTTWDGMVPAAGSQGVYTRGDGARCTMAKIGGDVVMIMMLLLVSIIIYYYMNTFITLHQCTFNLLFALFSTLSQKKHPRCF